MMKKVTTNTMLKRAESKQFVIDIFYMFCGVIAYTFGWTAFILSQDITSGGLAGITTIIQSATGIAASIPYNIINGCLLLLSIMFLGWNFSLKTVIGVGMLFFTIPIGQALFTPTDLEFGMRIYESLPAMVKGLPNVGPLLTDKEPFVALIIGSIFCGIGLGFVFSANGCTGGNDVVVAIINKYRNVSLGKAMITLDAIIVTTGAIIGHYFGPQFTWTESLGKLAYSVIQIVIVGQMLDSIMNMNKQSIQFMIFSPKYTEINDAIVKKLNRGCTILTAEGGYSLAPTKVLLVVARKRRSTEIYRIIKDIDPTAFVSEARVRGVYGEGFDALQSKKK